MATSTTSNACKSCGKRFNLAFDRVTHEKTCGIYGSRPRNPVTQAQPSFPDRSSAGQGQGPSARNPNPARAGGAAAARPDPEGSGGGVARPGWGDSNFASSNKQPQNVASQPQDHQSRHQQQYSNAGGRAYEGGAQNNAGGWSQAHVGGAAVPSQSAAKQPAQQNPQQYGAKVESGWGSAQNFYPAGSHSQGAASQPQSRAQQQQHMSISQTTSLPLIPLERSSAVGKEFALQNPKNQFNCFLNIALQAIWVFPALRTGIRSFCDMTAGGPAELKPFINALQTFFGGVQAHQDQQDAHQPQPLLQTDCNQVRIELFKLNYLLGEFVLNDKADAQECLNFILTQMHTWMQCCTTPPDNERERIFSKSNYPDVTVKLDALAKVVKCSNPEPQSQRRAHPCFIHEMYFFNHQQLQICSCNKSSGVLSMDENLFCQLVNMTQMEQAYDQIAMKVASHNLTAERLERLSLMSEPEQQVENMVGYYGLFFEALKEQLIQREKHCLTHEAAEGGGTPMFTKDNGQHSSYYKNLLQKPFPEVFTLNLAWKKDPMRASVLKSMIAIPQRFNVQELYNTSKQQPQEYVLRGMICFSEGGHYLGFFRRILIKVEHLVSITTQNLQSEFRSMEKEITPQTEWVQYNDTELKFVRDNFPGVIELCIENNFIPTVLFYEKLADQQDDTQYNESRFFALTRTKLTELSDLANQLDRLAHASIEELYGADELEEQRRLMEEIQAASAKQKDGDKPGAIQQMQAAVSEREESTQSDAPANQSGNQPGLRHSRTLNYQVVWFDGPAERLQSQVFQQHEEAFEFYKRVSKVSDTRLVLRGEEIVVKDAAQEAKLQKLRKMALQLQASAEEEQKSTGSSEYPAGQDNRTMNRQQSISIYHTEMTQAELVKHQSQEDESMRKFRAEENKMKKLKQFRAKYVDLDVYLHVCNVCKLYGMILRMETCALCGSPNPFHMQAQELPQAVLQLMVDDLLALESHEVTSIQPLPEQYRPKKQSKTVVQAGRT